MKKIVLYGHGSSHNHGCEAIVRSTVQIIRQYVENAKIILYSNNPDNDYKWGLNEVVDEIRKMPNPSLISRIKRKIKTIFKIKNNDINNSIAKKFTNEQKDIDLAISIGGDNYCYSKEFNTLFYKINELLNKRDIKTIFWGCSIEEKYIDDNMLKDLKKYKLITVREKLTEENLRKNGIINNVKLIPDTAFLLESKPNDYSNKLDVKKQTIGINISPMILEYENQKDITLENYNKLMEYILKNTNYSIALISHVVDAKGGDYTTNSILYEKFSEYKDRILLVPEMKAENIKNVISKCSIFVGARTHATIAAYSTCVPTLVVGYSIKANGIANDLFGTYENYIIPVQSLKEKEDLTKSFQWIEERKEQIKDNLQKIIPDYVEKIMNSGQYIKEIMKE